MLAITSTAILIIAGSAVLGITALLVGGSLARPPREGAGGPYWLRLLGAVVCALGGFAALGFAFVLGMCASSGGWNH